MQEGQNNNQVTKKSNPFSIVAIVCGILATIGAFIPYTTYVAWIIGVLGIVFGALGMKKANETNTGHGLSVAGLVLGIIGTVIGFIGFLCIVICAAALASVAEESAIVIALL